MARPTSFSFFTSCSLIMASLFALSASFQFNDPDWYFWIPLYVSATIVNLVNAVDIKSNKTTKTAKLALGLGLFLLIKVVIEDVKGGIAGIWSMDMRERVVREKFGSSFVIFTMFLQLKASSTVNIRSKIQRAEAKNHVKYGMAILVAFSYGVSFVFFVFQKNEMKF